MKKLGYIFIGLSILGIILYADFLRRAISDKPLGIIKSQQAAFFILVISLLLVGFSRVIN